MLNERVTVVDKISKRDYTDEGHVQRLKFVGKSGIVVAEHNSHGKCYDVAFGFLKNKIATFDPDELILTPF
jgi:hypothetical protein